MDAAPDMDAAPEWDLDQAVHGGQKQNSETDKGLIVRFFNHPKLNRAESDQQGRPIYDDTEYVTIMKPGYLSSIVTRPVSKRDKHRFRQQYEAFLRNEHQEVSGTPLSETPLVSRARAEELKYLKIFTVEQLAAVNDNHAANVRGLTDLKTKAIAYLEAAEKNQAPSRLVSEVDDLSSQLKVSEMNRQKLIDRVDELQAQIAALHKLQNADQPANTKRRAK